MFLGIFTAAAGIYVILIALGVLHRKLLTKGGDGPRRMGMGLFGAGMFIVGFYAIYHSYTLYSNRNNPSYQAPGRSGTRGTPAPGGKTPLFPPRSAPQNPR